MRKRAPAPPPEIPGFRFLEALGSGGFADVYLYEQERPRRRVAVKVLLPGLCAEDARAGFDAEANLMARLSSHPYIVTVYEANITAAGNSYLAMEYCSRPSLDVRFRQGGMPVGEVLSVGIQVASAVETAHRAGISHRDIKPANILTTDYNRPALTDFGISGTTGAGEEEGLGMSIPWSPPEALTGGRVDGIRLDIWALGATLYTLLAGRSPFMLPGSSNTRDELIDRISTQPLRPTGRDDVPESLELALATAMAKSPHSRYSSASAFALTLQRIQAELSLAATVFEVPEDNNPTVLDDDGDERTRVCRVISIDPSATTASPTRGRNHPAGPRRRSPAPGERRRNPHRPTGCFRLGKTAAGGGGSFPAADGHHDAAQRSGADQYRGAGCAAGRAGRRTGDRLRGAVNGTPSVRPGEHGVPDEWSKGETMAELAVDFCGEWHEPGETQVFCVGREGDLVIDDNPYLHRKFLTISKDNGMWWLTNIGSRISATIADSSGGMQAWVAPGARIPLVFEQTRVIFSAGPTTYEFDVHVQTPAFRQDHRGAQPVGDTTIGPVLFTESQKAVIVALAEPLLKRDGTGYSSLPTSADAARRLGWLQTRFNRKLDNVCEKLHRVGVAGLRGGPGRVASNRRARLVEYAVTSQLVTAADLVLLDRSAEEPAAG